MKTWGAARAGNSCERDDLEELLFGSPALDSVCHSGCVGDCCLDGGIVSVQPNARLGKALLHGNANGRGGAIIALSFGADGVR